MSQFAAQPAASVIPEELLYGVDGAIATITLNASQRMNTISGPMLRQLTDALVRANEDKDVRVVILTGTGRAFCEEGADVQGAIVLQTHFLPRLTGEGREGESLNRDVRSFSD